MKILYLVLLLLFLVSCSHAQDAVTQASPGYRMSKIAESGSRFTMQETEDIVAYHNQSRAKVGAGPLSWSNKVAEHAQEWADYLVKSGCKLKHRSNRIYGENIYKGSNTGGVIQAAQLWESEKKYYRGQVLNNSNWAKTGHYTQMVWKNSEQIGCGKAECNGSLIVVCNYEPAGNLLGQKPY